MAQTPPSLQLGTGIQVLNPVPAITDEGPYASVAAANAAINISVRYPGKKVMITGLGWYSWSLITGVVTDAGLLPDASGGGSSEITNTTIIAQLQNNSNWTDNTYTGTAITGQASGNFFVDSNFDYKFYSGGTKVRRIPFKYL